MLEILSNDFNNEWSMRENNVLYELEIALPLTEISYKEAFSSFNFSVNLFYTFYCPYLWLLVKAYDEVEAYELRIDNKNYGYVF